jgi:glucose-6-phosphate 1-dehydrogenase
VTPVPSLVIIGASGDLARRLLFPALFRLEVAGRLPELRIIGYALEGWDVETFRRHVREGLERFAGRFPEDAWRRFSSRLSYSSGELSASSLTAIRKLISGPTLFYLALPPGVFAEAAQGLAAAGLSSEGAGWRRLVIEKPFGTDLASARELNRLVHRDWREDQIFRIDHFLGKETTQNILVFRFANGFLEPLLNCHHISQVQITVAETLGLEGRSRYYDQIGALRDMLQNHLMQLFTLTAIEPPALWDPDVLREHKVEVLKAVQPLLEKDVQTLAVRGQYVAGKMNGESVPAYREEEGIGAGSATETFAAIRLRVNNWRWKGVPFYLRSGKRLKKDMSEVALQFREAPTRLFRETPMEKIEPNWLIFKLKPRESIDLIAHAKSPGLELVSRAVNLHAPYERKGDPEFTAYEQLLLDAIEGDRTSFLRFDEVEWSWQILEPVLKAWSSGTPEPYTAGSEGPAEQSRILDQGHHWRPLD